MRKLSLLLLFVVLPAFAGTPELETVLRNMDAAAAKFTSLKADVKWVKYTAIVDDANAEEGTIAVRRQKDNRFDLKIEFEKPYPYFLLVQGTKVEIYRPKIAQVEEYDLSKSRETLEQALLLGFGTSGKYLSENYSVTMQGSEEAGGEETVKLSLVPKKEDLRQKMPKLEMWISTKTWQPNQEKLYEQNPGDYRLYSYTDIIENPSLKDSDFKLDIAKNTKRIFPQK